MCPGRLAGRLRPRVSIAVASMRARGCLRLCSPRTVSAAAERSLSPGTGDPVAGLVVRLLEAPHRSGRQRTVPPIDGPRRESRLGQATLDRPHPLRSVGLEVSGSRSQRSAGKRPPGMWSDDAVDRESASLLKAADSGNCQRAIAAIHGTWRDPLLDELALERPNLGRSVLVSITGSDCQHGRPSGAVVVIGAVVSAVCAVWPGVISVGRQRHAWRQRDADGDRRRCPENA